jgi:hypothetical protein
LRRGGIGTMVYPYGNPRRGKKTKTDAKNKGECHGMITVCGGVLYYKISEVAAHTRCYMIPNLREHGQVRMQSMTHDCEEPQKYPSLLSVRVASSPHIASLGEICLWVPISASTATRISSFTPPLLRPGFRQHSTSLPSLSVAEAARHALEISPQLRHRRDNPTSRALT